VIGFAYAGFQAYDLIYHIATGKHVIRHHLRHHFNLFMDQVIHLCYTVIFFFFCFFMQNSYILMLVTIVLHGFHVY
jgi:hypothetical protein